MVIATVTVGIEGDQIGKIHSSVPDLLSAAPESHNPGHKCHTEDHATLLHHNKAWIVIVILKKAELIPPWQWLHRVGSPNRPFKALRFHEVLSDTESSQEHILSC